MTTDRQLELMLKLLIVEARPVPQPLDAPEGRHHTKRGEQRDARRREQHRK